MAQGPRACPFCGGTSAKMTQEHLWPQWLPAKFPTGTIFKVMSGRRQEWPGSKLREVRVEPEKTWQSSKAVPLTTGVRECCNSTWMSQLETAAQSVILGMFDGADKRMKPAGQNVIASWAQLKFMVADLMFQSVPGGFFSQAEREAFRQRQMPEDTHILAAYTTEEGEFGRVDGRQLRIPILPGNAVAAGYISTMQVGPLVLSGHWLRLPSDTPPELILRGAPWHEPTVQVWPPSPRALTWPPTFVLGQAGLKAFPSRLRGAVLMTRELIPAGVTVLGDSRAEPPNTGSQ